MGCRLLTGSSRTGGLRVGRVAQQNTDAVPAQQFVQPVDDRTLAIQIESERVQVKLFKRNIGEAFQFDAQDRGLRRA